MVPTRNRHDEHPVSSTKVSNHWSLLGIPNALAKPTWMENRFIVSAHDTISIPAYAQTITIILSSYFEQRSEIKSILSMDPSKQIE